MCLGVYAVACGVIIASLVLPRLLSHYQSPVFPPGAEPVKEHRARRQAKAPNNKHAVSELNSPCDGGAISEEFL